MQPSHHAQITTATLNTQSCTTPKLQSVVNFINQHHIDLLVLTETWHTSNQNNIFEEGHIAQSPPHGRQGIIILGRGKVQNFQPILPSLWTPKAIAVKVTLKIQHRLTSLNLIGYYGAPSEKTEAEETLSILAEHCRHLSGSTIIVGDFNCNVQQARKFAEQHGLRLTQNRSQELITHRTIGNQRGSDAQLDYIMTDSIYTDSKVITDELLVSDHNLLQTCITIDPQGQTERKTKPKPTHVIPASFTITQAINILKHPAILSRPFALVARILGYTIKRRPRLQTKATQLISNASKNITQLTDVILKRNREAHSVDTSRKEFLTTKAINQKIEESQGKLGDLVYEALQTWHAVSIKTLIESIRSQHQRQFFTIMPKLLRLKQRAVTALGFKPITQNNKVQEVSIVDHIRETYEGAHLTNLAVAQNEQPIHIEISREEVEAALYSVGLKAVGTDGIDAKWMKHKGHEEEILTALHKIMKKWIGEGKLPKYTCETRVHLLSKTPSQYPPKPKIRLIQITSSLFKLAEKIIFAKLQQHVKEQNLIHPMQRGFKEGTSTTTNLVDLADICQANRQTLKRQAKEKVPSTARTRHYYAFLDIAQAFDSVRRDYLINCLRNKGFDPDLVQLLQLILSQTSMRLQDGQVINTSLGTPQGSCLSPILWNLFINDLIELLNNEATTTLAFADDIVIIAKRRSHLETALARTERWLAKKHLKLNCAKSGILISQSDKRQAKRDPKTIRGIPVVTSYKYLGVIIENDLQLKIQHEELAKLKRAFIGKLSAPINKKLPLKARYIVWKSFFIPKALYGNRTLMAYSPKLKEQLHSVLYQSLRVLFYIRSLPARDSLCKSVLGISGDQYLTALTEKTELAQKLLREADGRLKSLIEAQAGALILFKVRHLVQPVATDPKTKQRIRTTCPCHQTMTHSHITTCPIVRIFWQEAISGTHYTSVDEAIESATQPMDLALPPEQLLKDQASIMFRLQTELKKRCKQEVVPHQRKQERTPPILRDQIKPKQPRKRGLVESSLNQMRSFMANFLNRVSQIPNNFRPGG